MEELGKKKARVVARKQIKTEMFYLDHGIRKGSVLVLFEPVMSVVVNFNIPYL